jgi:hypothetical protein
MGFNFGFGDRCKSGVQMKSDCVFPRLSIEADRILSSNSQRRVVFVGLVNVCNTSLVSLPQLDFLILAAMLILASY